jgi:histidinol phosphatase-like enzyme (inositol monophosphatase family)
MDELFEFARELSDASGSIIRKYFRSKVAVETKADFSPVTIADKKAEEAMRGLIMERFPDHGIIGEEFGCYNPDSEYQWILDPIDGTKTFISGTYLFGTLIALLKDDQPVLGVINNPIVHQFLVGNGEQTWLNGERVHIRPCRAIEEATLLVTSHWNVHQYRNGAAFDALAQRVKLYRSWGDCHGYFLVATGFADIMIDAVMNLWDTAALMPIIEGAGGKITDYYGNDPLRGEGAIATAGDIHDEVIKALNPE